MSISVFFLVLSRYSFCFFASVRHIKLAVRQLLGARKYSLLYRVVYDHYDVRTLTYRDVGDVSSML